MVPASFELPRELEPRGERAVLDLAVDLEGTGAGLVTEREMRHHDEAGRGRSGERRWGITLPAAAHAGLHYPDLVILPAAGDVEGGVVAVEVERTAKNRTRLERIMTGYARARHVAEARYYVPTGRIADYLTRTARSIGAESIVSVVEWDGFGELPTIAEAGHFLQEDAPAELAAAVVALWTGDG